MNFEDAADLAMDEATNEDTWFETYRETNRATYEATELDTILEMRQATYWPTLKATDEAMDGGNNEL